MMTPDTFLLQKPQKAIVNDREADYYIYGKQR